MSGEEGERGVGAPVGGEVIGSLFGKSVDGVGIRQSTLSKEHREASLTDRTVRDCRAESQLTSRYTQHSQSY